MEYYLAGCNGSGMPGRTHWQGGLLTTFVTAAVDLKRHPPAPSPVPTKEGGATAKAWAVGLNTDQFAILFPHEILRQQPFCFEKTEDHYTRKIKTKNKRLKATPFTHTRRRRRKAGKKTRRYSPCYILVCSKNKNGCALFNAEKLVGQ